MSEFCTSRHFAAMRKYRRYLGIADFGERSGRQIFVVDPPEAKQHEDWGRPDADTCRLRRGSALARR
jgi:hypothetical protein